MTKKRFTRDNHTGYLYDNGEIVEDIMELLNGLNNENEQLKDALNQRTDQCDNYYKENEQLRKELEDWKSNCLSTINENSILWNEIAIMREQGAKPSSAFEEYCSKFKGDLK